MGISIRHYLFLKDGSLRRVSQRITEGMTFGQDAIPEFAGTRVQVVEVILETADRRPARILDASGHFWEFDGEGKIDMSLRRTMAEFMNVAFAPPPQPGAVVDLMPEIKKRKLREKHRWPVTAELLDRIAADLWPGVHGPAPEVSSVKGKAPKKPPLTSEARSAMRRVEEHLEGIKSTLGMLSERALKGLAFEAVRTGLWEDETLWRGIADEAKRLEAIRAAHRTGRGEWYAVVEVARESSDHPYVWEHLSAVHEKCSSRKAAVDAARRLMVEKAEWVGPDMEISVNVRSALEWRPEEWE